MDHGGCRGRLELSEQRVVVLAEKDEARNAPVVRGAERVDEARSGFAEYGDERVEERVGDLDVVGNLEFAPARSEVVREIL